MPEVLFGGLLHLVFRELELQTSDILPHLGKFVAVDDLSTGEDGLDGRDPGNGTVLHHRNADGVGKGRQCLGGEHLCEGCPQLRGHILRQVQGGLSHTLVGIEPETRTTDVGEVLRESLPTLLLGGINRMSGTANGNVILQSRILQLLQRICLGCRDTTAYRTEDEG